MDKEERLSRQMEFCREIDKEKQILRQTMESRERMILSMPGIWQ